jgi:hypothetical protein
MVAADLPSAGRVSLLHQPTESRYVVHLLYGPALQRGRCLVIEDLVPLFNVPVTVRLPQPVKRAWLAPQGEPLAIDVIDETTMVTVPRVECHQAVVFEV